MDILNIFLLYVIVDICYYFICYMNIMITYMLQWIFGLWDASWLNSSLAERCFPVLTVSFHCPYLSYPTMGLI